MKNIIKGLSIGIFTGFLLAGIIMMTVMPKMMLHENVSPLSYQDTIQKLESAVTNGGWVVSSKIDMQKSLARHGKTAPQVTLLKICQADYAAKILNEETALYVSVMMPCTIAVYQKKDGKTYVSTINTKMMGKMFGGVIAEVMAGKVSEDAEQFTAFLHRH